MPSQVQPVKMDSVVEKLSEDLLNITLDETKSEELRRNQNIFTEEKKTGSQVKVIKPRNDELRSPAASGDVTKNVKVVKKSSEIPTSEVKTSNEPPAFQELRFERAFENLSIHAKAGGTKEAATRCEIRTLGPPGIPVPSRDRDDDEFNPAKWSRPNRSPEGPVDDLNTPTVYLKEPVYPAVPAQPPTPEYPRQASPTDSGYAPSPPAACTELDGTELPREVNELLDQFFYRVLEDSSDVTFSLEQMSSDIMTSLEQMNISAACQARVVNKIDAFLEEGRRSEVDPLPLPELAIPERVSGGKDFGDLNDEISLEAQLNLSNIITLVQPDNPCSAPTYRPDVPVPVTVEICATANTPSYGSSQKRLLPIDSRFPTSDARQALQQKIKDKMRTEPGCFGGYGGIRRPMTDISHFVQNLKEDERKTFEECRKIIQNYSDAEVTKINKQGDTLAHLYMIYSPENEHPDCPPRLKMRLLLYCLLERLNAMKKLVGAEGLINRKNDKGQTPLYLAACVVNFPMAVRMFLHFGADPNLRRATKDLEGPAPIHKVVERGDDCAETLAHLLNDEKCDPNLLSNDGLTPLMIACRSHLSDYKNPDTGEVGTVSTLKCVEMFLINPRVDAFAQSASSGRAAIHYAVEKGNIDLIKVWKPYASRLKYHEEITSAKEQQRLVNVTDRDGNNVLHILAGLQLLKPETQMAVAHLLLEMGADVTRRNGERRIPRDLARSMKNTELATIFIMPKARKTSNPSRAKSSLSRSSGDISPPLDYSQSRSSFTYSPGAVFPTSPSDSGQRYSPPNTSPTHPGQTGALVDMTSGYMPNGGQFVFGAQNTGYAMSGGQSSTIQFCASGGGSPISAGQYSPPGGLSPQGAGRLSPPGAHSPSGHFATNTQGGISPQRVAQFSPQHSPQGIQYHQQTSPQGTGQYSPGGHSSAGQYSPGGHSSAGQYSPGGHSSAGQYSPGGHSSAGQYSPGGHSSAGQYSPGGHSPQGAAGQYTQQANYVQTTPQYNHPAGPMNVFQAGQFLPPQPAGRPVGHLTQYNPAPHSIPATRQNPGEVYSRDGDANPFGDVLTGNKL